MAHPKSTGSNPNPSGLCLCGCGEPTRIAPRSHGHVGWVKGFPTKYIKGHNTRLSPVEYIIDESTGCWNWQRTINKWGYGDTTIKGKKCLAHRLIWSRLRGPIPEGLEMDHLCRNRRCVNPDNLEVVTRTENQRRRPDRSNLQDVIEMRELRKQGWTLIRLSEKFNLSIASVCKICNHDTWNLD